MIAIKTKKKITKVFIYVKQVYFVSIILSHSVTIFLSIFYISNFNNFISSLTTEDQKYERLLDTYTLVFGLLQCA